MGRDVLGVVSGLVVLAIGVITVVNLTGPEEELPVENPAPATTIVAESKATVAKPIEGFPGVGPAVGRVLQWSGNAGLAHDDELGELPPSVADVLMQYRTPLLVSTASGPAQ